MKLGIHGELLKLGIDIGETSVGKYMLCHRKPPTQTWRTFLDNHMRQIVSVDFFTVPTIRFKVLYVFLVLAHERRRILHFNVTTHPTAEWTAQQLRNAFPWESGPRYLLRDRDRIFGDNFTRQVQDMGIEQVLSCAAIPVAKGLRRARHWYDPTGMPRSCGHLQRSGAVPPGEIIRGILSPVQNASLAI